MQKAWGGSSLGGSTSRTKVSAAAELMRERVKGEEVRKGSESMGFALKEVIGQCHSFLDLFQRRSWPGVGRGAVREW